MPSNRMDSIQHLPGGTPAAHYDLHFRYTHYIISLQSHWLARNTLDSTEPIYAFNVGPQTVCFICGAGAGTGLQSSFSVASLVCQEV